MRYPEVALLMKLAKAKPENAEEIFGIVQETIMAVYPLYYPRGVVDFFCALHSRDAISSDIDSGETLCLSSDGKIVGVGCLKGNHITRVYVKPLFHGKGFGSIIMNELEEIIADSFDTAILDASLPAVLFYEHRGYKTMRHTRYDCEGGSILVYDVMEKKLP